MEQKTQQLFKHNLGKFSKVMHTWEVCHIHVNPGLSQVTRWLQYFYSLNALSRNEERIQDQNKEKIKQTRTFLEIPLHLIGQIMTDYFS